MNKKLPSRGPRIMHGLGKLMQQVLDTYKRAIE